MGLAEAEAEDAAPPAAVEVAVVAPGSAPPGSAAPSSRPDESTRARADRGVSAADVLALGLPDDYDLEAALGVAETGVAELALLELP